MASATVEQTRKANWLELFYDLVFAAAVITFSDAVSHNPEPAVIGVVSASFVAVWLIWLATTFYVNSFGIDDSLHRFLVVVQMLLLTLVSLAVGDGLDRNPELASVSFALLAINVGIMYGRHARSDEANSAFATMRRNQYLVAALPVLVAAVVPVPVRAALWAISIVLVAIPALGCRVGGLAPGDTARRRAPRRAAGAAHDHRDRRVVREGVARRQPTVISTASTCWCSSRCSSRCSRSGGRTSTTSRKPGSATVSRRRSGGCSGTSCSSSS